MPSLNKWNPIKNLKISMAKGARNHKVNINELRIKFILNWLKILFEFLELFCNNNDMLINV